VCNIPLPDLIKIDVQGAELDVLMGATKTLESCKDLLIDLQDIEYNIGGPLKNQVILYLTNLGFKLVSNYTSTGIDGYHHFQKT
jgi:hypothetical protein